jgi:hypothetical protein
LYDRVPSNYRIYDADQGQPLLALLRVIAEQVANVREDLDSLWDNFFIETCQDWAVPYIAALVGTRLVANPVGRSNRLEVRDTVRWRRSKGTPAMLEALAQETSTWPTDFAEFFRSLGWAQNLNHVRLDRPLTPDLRDSHKLALLGHAADPFAHAADFKPGHDLDQSRVTSRKENGAWGTPGRYQIKNVGFFVRRLQVFPIRGATPAAVDPGASAPSNASWFTFDPLHREIPLFVESTAAPLTRAAFDQAPWLYFGKDLGVRQSGVLLASPSQPQADSSSSATPFSFGQASGTLALDKAAGMRLLNPRKFELGSAHFWITAWLKQGGTALGAISTLHAARGDSQTFLLGSSASGAGQLVITIETGASKLGLVLPPSPAARFPGAVVAIRAARTDAPHFADALYVYLPTVFLTPGQPLTYFVADDGSTYHQSNLDPASLARASEGQVFPATTPASSVNPAIAFRFISRTSGALQIADTSRLAGAQLLLQAEIFTGVFQPQGAIATVAQQAASYTYLQVPNPWPALTFGPALNALTGDLPSQGILTIYLKPLAGNFIPSCELIVRNRAGDTLLVYLPEISNAPPAGMRVFVAEDGSTWFAPSTIQSVPPFLNGLPLARAATGQAQPIPGVWPLQYRRPIGVNLCRPERAVLVQPGELGIDPELGYFAFAPGDPAIGLGRLNVDYVEAFSDRVGALNYDRLLDATQTASRLVSQFGDADNPKADKIVGAPVYETVAAAVAAAASGDVIEILDSATYAASTPIALSAPSVKKLTIRAAAGQRPCLTFYQASNVPAASSFNITIAMDAMEFNGLLVSGGPLIIGSKVAHLLLAACTFDPRNGNSLVSDDNDLTGHSSYVLCRCVAGGVRVGAGVARLTVADSIIDQQRGLAVAGLAGPGSPPSSPPVLDMGAPSVQLERATVLGRIFCNVLSASESILDEMALAQDQQSGCIRFSRYESGSVLPRRYLCVPSEDQASVCTGTGRCYAPLFNSRRFGRPDYGQLAQACPPEILSASEQRSEVGAFTGNLNPIRLENVRIKLQEFLPTSLVAVVVAET